MKGFAILELDDFVGADTGSAGERLPAQSQPPRNEICGSSPRRTGAMTMKLSLRNWIGACAVLWSLTSVCAAENEPRRPAPGGGEEAGRGDDPEFWSGYWAKLHGGSQQAAAGNALPNAIQQVRRLRNRAAQQANVPAFAAALLANRGAPVRRIAGIPLGPLPATAPPGLELPAPAAMLDIPQADRERIERLMQPRSVPLAAHVSPTDWQWLGPGNIGGRTRSILVHPNNPQIMWLGGVAGGVWKTTDAGLTWAPMHDFMASLVVSCMELDPSDPDTLYVGTGEGFFNADAFRGFGIFRSEDGGATWNQVPATATEDFRWVNRVAVSPDGETLLVATREGLFRSTDDGATFTRVSVPVSTLPGTILEDELLDVRIHPTDSQKCVASGRGGQAFVSENGGQDWTAANGIPVDHNTFTGRVELAYAVANPDVVYASVDFAQGRVYRSTNGGRDFVLRGTPGHLKSQGWYANTIWAGDTVDPNLVVVGGLDLHRSSDGGLTFTRISDWRNTPNSPHADHHVIASHAGYNGTTNRTVFFGNDGGCYRAEDVAAVSQLNGWEELNNGLGITQFYGAAVNHETGELVGGTQDNGTLFRTPSAGPEGFVEIAGGDGAFAAAHPTKRLFYGEFQWMQLHRSANGGASASIDQNLPEAGLDDGTVLFIAPFILDPNDPQVMLAGGARLWRSENVEAANPVWKSVKPVFGLSAVSAIAVAPGNSSTIWVGHELDFDDPNPNNAGAVFRTTDAMAAMPDWQRSGDGVLPRRHCTRITVDPHDIDRVYVTFGGYENENLWVTDDAGETWDALGEADLPDVPAYDVEVHPDDADVLILGNEVGLFVSDDRGATWLPTNQGPTNCAVFELIWRDRTLYAATHGRGIFRIETTSPAAAEPEAAPPFAAPRAKAVVE